MNKLVLLFIVMLTIAATAAVEFAQPATPAGYPKLGTVTINADSTFTYQHTGPDVSDIYAGGGTVYDTLYLVARDLPDGVFSADADAGEIVIQIQPSNVGPVVNDAAYEILEHTTKTFGPIQFQYVPTN